MTLPVSVSPSTSCRRSLLAIAASLLALSSGVTNADDNYRKFAEGQIQLDDKSDIPQQQFSYWVRQSLQLRLIALPKPLTADEKAAGKKQADPIAARADMQYMGTNGKFAFPWSHGKGTTHQPDPKIEWSGSVMDTVHHNVILWPRSLGQRSGDYDEFTMTTIQRKRAQLLISHGKDETVKYEGSLADAIRRGSGLDSDGETGYEQAAQWLEDLGRIYAENIGGFVPTSASDRSPNRLSGLIQAHDLYREALWVTLERLRTDRRNIKAAELELYRSWLSTAQDKASRFTPEQGYVWRLLETCHQRIEHAFYASRPGRKEWPAGKTLADVEKSFFAGADDKAKEESRTNFEEDLQNVWGWCLDQTLRKELEAHNSRDSLGSGQQAEEARLVLNKFMGRLRELERAGKTFAPSEEMTLSEWRAFSNALRLIANKKK